MPFQNLAWKQALINSAWSWVFLCLQKSMRHWAAKAGDRSAKSLAVIMWSQTPAQMCILQHLQWRHSLYLVIIKPKSSWFSETCRGYFQLLIFHGLICCLNKNNERRATMWHSSQKCKKFCKFTIILMFYWKEKLKDNMDVSSVVLKGKKLFS